jgi:hypothetical protein
MAKRIKNAMEWPERRLGKIGFGIWDFIHGRIIRMNKRRARRSLGSVKRLL